MISTVIDKDSLAGFEVEILKRLVVTGDEYILPYFIQEDDRAISLSYHSENCVPVSEFDFGGDLNEVYSFLRSYLRAVRRIKDMLLRIDIFSFEKNMIFVDGISKKPKFICGYIAEEVSDDKNAYEDNSGAESSGSASVSPYTDYVSALMPALSMLSGKRNILNIKPAMSDIALRLKKTNPGYRGALTELERSQARWSYDTAVRL